MKRTCKRCRAWSCCGGHCDLGFDNTSKEVNKVLGMKLNGHPQEECPKPKNNDDYVYLLSLKNTFEYKSYMNEYMRNK